MPEKEKWPRWQCSFCASHSQTWELNLGILFHQVSGSLGPSQNACATQVLSFNAVLIMLSVILQKSTENSQGTIRIEPYRFVYHQNSPTSSHACKKEQGSSERVQPWETSPWFWAGHGSEHSVQPPSVWKQQLSQNNYLLN